MRTFLVDGFVAGMWQINGATIHLRPFRPLRAAEERAVAREAEGLLGFMLPDPSAAELRLHPAG
jgi:hypothetical protein